MSQSPTRSVSWSPLAALAGAALLAACSTPAPPPAPLPPAPIAAHAPAPPPVGLSASVVEQASEFRTYMRRAATIAPPFANGAAIEQALSDAEAFEPQQLSRGAVAYAAVVALQEPGFVAGVRTYAVDPDQRKALAQKLISDPYYATALPGAQAAAGLIIASLKDEGSHLADAGEKVRLSAYDIQKQAAWSKTSVSDPAGRLARAKTTSAMSMAPDPADVTELKRAVTGSDGQALQSRVASLGASASAPPFTQAVTRGLAVAAVAALGEATEENDAALNGLLNDSTGGFCLNMTKLNLYQCLSVAKPWYEDVFCLGRHVMIDTGQCVAKAAGQSHPAQPLPVAGPDPSAGPAAAGPSGGDR
jgi:hypothetical protein